MSKELRELFASLEAAKNEAKAVISKANATEDEVKAAQSKISAIEAKIEVQKRLDAAEPANGEPQSTTLTKKEQDILTFKNFIVKNAPMNTGEQNLDGTNVATLIPTTIANMVIEKIKEICPIYAKATIFHAKGTLKIPVYGDANSTHNVNVGYATEFTELTADAGKFTSVDLGGFLIGALSLIGISEINSAEIDIVQFVVDEMARKIADFIEKEDLNGTTDKCTGALSTTTSISAASATAVTSDELIDLQAKIPSAYQKNACFIMHPDTFTAIRKLKDTTNRYLLQENVTNEFPYMLLGKPVYVSDNMPKMEASNKAILYGDLSGLAINMRENIGITVLREKYITQHAVGVVAWLEMDSKVIDNQKLAVITMKAA